MPTPQKLSETVFVSPSSVGVRSPSSVGVRRCPRRRPGSRPRPRRRRPTRPRLASSSAGASPTRPRPRPPLRPRRSAGSSRRTRIATPSRTGNLSRIETREPCARYTCGDRPPGADVPRGRGPRGGAAASTQHWPGVVWFSAGSRWTIAAAQVGRRRLDFGCELLRSRETTQLRFDVEAAFWGCLRRAPFGRSAGRDVACSIS